jgi:hypothetical protein
MRFAIVFPPAESSFWPLQTSGIRFTPFSFAPKQPFQRATKEANNRQLWRKGPCACPKFRTYRRNFLTRLGLRSRSSACIADSPAFVLEHCMQEGLSFPRSAKSGQVHGGSR